jgi:hypothetical protein
MDMDSNVPKATNVLIFGILSLVCCAIIFGPLAIIQGNQGLQAIREGRGDASQEGTYNIGKILGIVGLVLWVIGIIVNIVMGGALLAMGRTS